MLIRHERPDDADAIADLHLAAFGEHGTVVNRIVERVRELEEPLSLVAADGDRVIGHVMFSTGWIDADRELVAVKVLSPIGVLPDRQREGVGAALIEEGVKELTEQGIPLVALEGDPRYYRLRGFRAASELFLKRPSKRIPEQAFQVRELAEYRTWMTGRVVYSQAFWETDSVGFRD
ncbi:GNAT family N-acetyltransferase [Salininema proteolyticum]|uniref:GNAT family N-acetyltransferase n=1 Tax=Salininema proteolyticum TaxID=1607685 RepID=A0ABV8U0K4_9ACTN